MSRYRPALHRTSTSPLAAAVLLIAAGMLASCGSSPSKPGDSGATLPAQVTDADLPGSDIVLPEALPDSDYEALFKRVEAALADFDWMHAEATLTELAAPLNTNDRVYRDYLRARIAYLRGQVGAARRLLESFPPPGTAPALSAKVLNFQRYMKRMDRDYLASALLGHRLLEAAPDQPGASALKRSIWRDLERLPPTAFETTESIADPQWRGWLTLGAISATTGDAATLREKLRQWRAQHPAHPAANPLPGGLGPFLDQPVKVTKVALLLPLSGRLAPAAKAVRDGYLASFYAARKRGNTNRELLILDTNSYGGPQGDGTLAAYQEAVRRGASLVVGPLSKQAVAELANSPDRPVPILALNRIDEATTPGTTALVQMSLAPEDEAEQLAELAYGGGARHVLLVRPAGAWGDKMEAALKRHWQAMGGEIIAKATYASPEGYSDSIKQSLNLEASVQRAREIRSMLATNVEASARRRQDIDAIFLLSGSSEEARSIKPLLAFHYAGNLPVYSPSSIYSGIADRRDRDLNGVKLVDLPWLLGDNSNSSLRVAIAAGDTGSDSYTRLNALGADAYLLQSRFGQLQGGADALLRGNTGLLSMDPQLHIVREPQPATFDGGELKRL